MAVTEEVPDLTPVSDSSASSGESLQSRETSRFHDVPVEVGDETRFRPLESRDEKHVSFGDCIVRKYPIALGDHPECTAGPPLTIGWEYCKASVTPVDVYESQRAPRRELRELQLDWIQRKRVLRSISAATDVEMLNAASEAEEVRRQRAKTVRMLTFESIEVPLQSLQRKIRRSFLREK